MSTQLVMLSFSMVLTISVPGQTVEKTNASEPGFVRLFNGTNLDGWREVQGAAGTFAVEDATIVGRRRPNRSSAYWLSTAKKYADFELRLQIKLESGGNSGIFIRVPSYKGRTSREGMEIQMLDDGAKKGKTGKGNTGAIYEVVAPSKFAARPAGEWNDVSIKCHGPSIQVRVNGALITDADMDKHDKIRKRPREGYIGLSAHTKVTKFRNLRLKVIK